MKGSRHKRNLAPGENAGLMKNAPGDVGSGTSRPSRTM
jgi:hypothetical protein